jgi:SpoVK/Ycf46/Vps4 family AAA+-type ATPase
MSGNASSFGRAIPPEKSIQNLTTASPGTNSNPKKSTDAMGKLATFESRKPKFSMEEVILPASVRQEITTLKSRITNHELIYRQWGFEAIDKKGVNMAVNLYGPPGTGKTMCAEALAADFGKPILEVNYAEIESKYVGDTPKNIVAAFRAAKQDNALLFFDEADSILGRRLTNVTQSADHGVNASRSVMLKQLDEFDGIVVFATNLARNYDGAFVRRILMHVFVAPPDESCRLLLWRKMISSKVPGAHAVDFAALARESDGLTGGLIKNATLLALSELAEQPCSERRFSTDHVRRAMGTVRRAHQEVGSSPIFAHAVMSSVADPSSAGTKPPCSG